MHSRPLGVHPDYPFLAHASLPARLKSPVIDQELPICPDAIKRSAYWDAIESKATMRMLCAETGLFQQPLWLALPWMHSSDPFSATLTEIQGKSQLTFPKQRGVLPERITADLIRDLFFDPKHADQDISFYIKPTLVAGGGKFVAKVTLNFQSQAVRMSSHSYELADKLEDDFPGSLQQVMDGKTLEIQLHPTNNREQFEVSLEKMLNYIPTPIIETLIPYASTSHYQRGEMRIIFHDLDSSGGLVCSGNYMKVSASEVTANISNQGSGAHTFETLREMIAHHQPEIPADVCEIHTQQAFITALQNAHDLVQHVRQRLIATVQAVPDQYKPYLYQKQLPRWCVDLAPSVSESGEIHWYLVEMQRFFAYTGLKQVNLDAYRACERADEIIFELPPIHCST